MGLMLSILIVCVGVIEALSCYEHFQYGVVHCAANVYENARRRSSVFLKYTSRRLKLLSDNSMPEYDEKSEKIFDPFEFVSGIPNNSENFYQHCRNYSIKPTRDFVKRSKKLEEEDKIQIVKTRLEKPAGPKTIRSISMPELLYTERDIQLSKIINNLAIEPIEETNIEIEDVNSEVVTKEFDKLFEEYENSSQITNSGYKEILLNNFDGYIIKTADGFKHSGEIKVDKLESSKCRENKLKIISEKVKSGDITKNRKDMVKLALEPMTVNSTRRMSLDDGKTTNLKLVKPMQECKKGSSFDRFTSVDFDAVAPVKNNKSKTVDLDVFPSSCKFYDDSSAAQIFLKELQVLGDTNNKFIDAIFESDTPPTEVVDKTFEEIYKDICDESLNETNAYEEIEKSILSGYERDAKADLEFKAFEGSQVLCVPNEVSLSEGKILSNNRGIVKETIPDAVFLKAVEQLAELIVKDTLNLYKIKNLVFEPSNNSNEAKNFKISDSLNDNIVISQERPNDENLKGNQTDLSASVEKNLSSKEGEIQKSGCSVLELSSDINLEPKLPEFDITFLKPRMEDLEEIENEKLTLGNLSISDSSTEKNSNDESDEGVINTVEGNIGGVVIEKNTESPKIGKSDVESPLKGKSKKRKSVEIELETEIHITKADNIIIECNELKIKNGSLASDLAEKENFSEIKKEKSSLVKSDNLKENLGAKIESGFCESFEALPLKHEGLLALEYKEEIKSEDKKETISTEHKELKSLWQVNSEKPALKLLEEIEESEKSPAVKSENSKTEILSKPNNYANSDQSTENAVLLPKYEIPLPLECKEGIKLESDKKETMSAEHKIRRDIKETRALQVANLGESALKSEEHPEFKKAGTFVLNFAKTEEAESEKLNFANFDKNAEFFHVNSDSGENKIFEHSTHSKNELNDDNKNVKSTNSPSEAFWLIFSGEYTKAMSKDWHSGHFSCWQCDEALTGQRYVLRDDHPYCIKCYESVFANVCEECNKIIGIDSKDLSYKDKHWHEACFLCNKCRVSLVDKQFGSKADKIYCGNCYDAQFASRCDGCGEIFRAGTKKMEYKTRQWHEKCFCCCVCKTPIGTKSFIPREQEIYCATCYEEKFATRCVKCNKIITSGGVTYKNEPWHRECFTCTNCNTSLAGQRFTSRDEKPYCADCFGELFAKRCTACNRPITGIGGTRFISFEDRHWHNDCFICASCKTSLVGRGFITDGDDIICPECAKQKLM